MNIKYCYVSLVVLFLLGFNPSKAQWRELGGVNSLRIDVPDFATAGPDKIFTNDNSDQIYFFRGFDTAEKVEVIPFFNKVDRKWYSIKTNNSYNLSQPLLFVDAIYSSKYGLVGIYENGQLSNFNGTSWNNLGYPVISDGGVTKNIIIDNNGDIYCIGFRKVVYLNYTQPIVLRFDGTYWVELKQNNNIYDVIDQTNDNNQITNIACDKYNNIYVVGGFNNKHVLKFDGINWSALPGFITSSTPSLITIDLNQNIYISGSIYNNNQKYYVAKFDGSEWSELIGTDSLNANNVINALHCDRENNIYVGGDFLNQFGNNYIAKFDGTSWTELGGDNSLNANGSILSIISDSNNNLYTGGLFKNNLQNFYIAEFPFCNVLKPLITTSSGNSVYCEGERLKLISSSTNGNLWSTGESTKEIEIDKAGQYFLNTVSPNGCVSDTTFIELREIFKQNITFEINPYINLLENSQSLFAEPSGGKFIGSGVLNNVFDPVKAGLGLKQIRYEVKDEFGCISNQTKSVIIYDTITCSVSVTDTLILNISKLGLTGINIDTKIKVYPNPTISEITIDIDQYLNLNGYNIDITDNNGQLILNQSITSKTLNINISNWSKGIYYLRIKDNSSSVVQVKKILLQ